MNEYLYHFPIEKVEIAISTLKSPFTEMFLMLPRRIREREDLLVVDKLKVELITGILHHRTIIRYGAR